MSERELLGGLVLWCEKQREFMLRANEMMKAGKMHIGSSDGVRMVDTTAESISQNEAKIAELEALLADIGATL